MAPTYRPNSAAATRAVSEVRNGQHKQRPARGAGAGVLVKTHSNYDALPQPLRLAVWTMQRAVIALHGMPPSGRDVAAAHEAGHSIVKFALLGGVVSADASVAVARESSGAWAGYSTLDDGDLDDVGACVHHAAGLAGEVLAGLAHPASSIDETIPAALNLAALRLVARGEAITGPVATTGFAAAFGFAQTLVTAAALRILLANQPQWQAVQRGLLERETLGYPALAKRVAGVRLPTDWRDGVDEFFGFGDRQLAAQLVG
jgi:hypothetical protein